MEISVAVGPVTTLTVKGDVDGSNFRDLIEKGQQVINQGYSRLILDLHDVPFISSAGLLALQTITGTALSKGGKLVLVGLDRNVQRAIQLSGFDKFLSIYGDLAAAQASFDVG